MMKFVVFVVVLAIWEIKPIGGCLGGLSDNGDGTGDDGSISDNALTANPTFDMPVNPLVAWTVPKEESPAAAFWRARRNGRLRRRPRNVNFNPNLALLQETNTGSTTEAGTGSTTKAGTGSTAEAGTGSTTKAGTGSTAEAGTGSTTKAGTGSTAEAGTGSTAEVSTGSTTKAGTGSTTTINGGLSTISGATTSVSSGGSSESTATTITTTTPKPTKQPAIIYPDQSPDPDQAQKKADKVLKMIFVEAFFNIQINLPSTAIFDFSKFQIIQVNLIGPANIANASPGDGVVINDVVAFKCTARGKCNQPFVVTQTIQIKNGPLLTGRQWKQVAFEMQMVLQEEGVRFNGPIVVS